MHHATMRHSFVKQVKHATKLAAKKSPLSGVLRRIIRKPHALDPAVRMGRIHGWGPAAAWLLSSEGRNVLEEPGFLASLSQTIGNDIERELLLTEVRRRLLLEARPLLKLAHVQHFACALIRQCINNDYVYFVSDEEKSAIKQIRSENETPDAGVGKDSSDAYLLALYMPPHRMIEGGLRPSEPSAAEGPIGNLLREYMATYMEEQKIKSQIEQISAVEADGSRPVASMYEDNPYPRWLDITPREAGARIADLRAHFAEHELPSMDSAWEVLAAGCGTGRDTIAMASGYGDRANVLAIDISRASLAYAIRKARGYNIKNIRFAQCDIHAVTRLARQFDIIECSGVLHHLKDPMVGWRLLVDRLRPGGLMYIALYSALARREVIKIRADVARRGGAVNADFIRSYRRQLMLEKPEIIDGGNLPNRWDFFSMSACRDLMFHVVEHQFSIPEIRKCLAELGLEFRGFELPGLLHDRYWSGFPSGSEWLNLEAWHTFEEKHPNTFISLYGFWCRKPA